MRTALRVIKVLTMRLHPSFCLLPALGLLVSGCAKSPSGGPTTPQAANRLRVSVQLQQPVNPSYFYAFAFDDDDDSSDGPGALTGTSIIANGVVGGSFTVLVLYNQGQFNAYRRSFSNGAESLIPIVGAFVTTPTVSGQTISFVLNLDARNADGLYLFRHSTGGGTPTLAVRDLDTNFITTNERRLDPNDSRPKAFDAFRTSPNSYIPLAIDQTIDYTNRNIGEPTSDVFSNDTSNTVNEAQLDLTDVNIRVERS
jgi:hypothetical protein